MRHNNTGSHFLLVVVILRDGRQAHNDVGVSRMANGAVFMHVLLLLLRLLLLRMTSQSSHAKIAPSFVCQQLYQCNARELTHVTCVD